MPASYETNVSRRSCGHIYNQPESKRLRRNRLLLYDRGSLWLNGKRAWDKPSQTHSRGPACKHSVHEGSSHARAHLTSEARMRARLASETRVRARLAQDLFHKRSTREGSTCAGLVPQARARAHLTRGLVSYKDSSRKRSAHEAILVDAALERSSPHRRRAACAMPPHDQDVCNSAVYLPKPRNRSTPWISERP